MAAVDPVSVEAVELTTETSTDGTLTDHTAGCIDDDTGTGVFKPGKGGTDGDGARIEFPGLSNIADGDTISIWLTAVHQIDDGIDLLAYATSNTVTTTARINKDAPISTGENIYTLTTAFIAELGDLSGNFAVRYVLRALEAGDVSLSEVDSNLTTAAPPARRIFVVT